MEDKKYPASYNIAINNKSYSKKDAILKKVQKCNIKIQNNIQKVNCSSPPKPISKIIDYEIN